MSKLFPLKKPISILMYHQVGPFERPEIHPAVYCSLRRFKTQMAMLHFGGYSVISVAEALECLFKGKTIPPRAVVLTFDDGADNFREFAVPVLLKYHFPATMYVCTNLLGKNTRDWIKDMPENFQSPLMTAETLRELNKEEIITFGAHTRNHVHLTQLSLDEMRTEIFDSKKELEDVLGEVVPDFCFPFGFYNIQAVQMVQDAGYRSAMTCVARAANYAPNPFLLPRKHIRYGDSIFGYWWKLNHKNKPPQEYPDTVES